MEYLKNKYRIDFQKTAIQDKNNIILQRILSEKSIFAGDIIDKNINEMVNEEILNKKRDRFREQFQLVAISAERETV